MLPWRARRRPSRPETADTLKAELDNAMKRLGELTGELLWAGEAPRPFSQKEVEKMSCTASVDTARPYGVKLVCRTWEQPRSSYYASRGCSGPQPRPAPPGK